MLEAMGGPSRVDDERWMSRALELAEATAGLSSPNPQVGCVLVGAGGERSGEGAHRYDARDHAEIVALKEATALGHDVRGATAFVTLEPCSHHGRTGPCADALIAAGIARCVVATADPNPEVSGRGLAKLRAAGMRVEVGVLEEPARRINDAFAWSIRHGVPMVTLKAGLSADGMLAPPPSGRNGVGPHWLTGPESRAEVQRMRHGADAVLTGIGTVLADDPLLTDRTGLPRRRALLRVVLDARLRIPLQSKLVASCMGDVLVFCGEGVDAGRVAALRDRGVGIEMVRGGDRLDLAAVLRMLHLRAIRSVLLEGGTAVNGAFLAAELVQRAVLFRAPARLGEGAVPFAEGVASAAAFEEGLQRTQRKEFGADMCVSGWLANPWAALGQLSWRHVHWID